MATTSQGEDVSAGATIVWFGKYKGQRLDELPNDYRAWAVYSDIGKGCRWHEKFAELNQRYLEDRMSSLKADERPGNQRRSWTKSQPFRVLYGNSGWRAWCHRKIEGTDKPQGWFWEFLDLESQFAAWLATHRRSYRPRKSSGCKRDIGQKCGPWDDKIDPVGGDDDRYDTDDDFIDDSGQLCTESDDEYRDDDSANEAGERQETQTDEYYERVYGNSEHDPVYEDENSVYSNEEEEEGGKAQGPRVMEIPTGNKIREAKDLFNDEEEDDMLEPSEVALGHLSDRPVTPDLHPSSSHKRAHGSDDLDHTDDEEDASPRKRCAAGNRYEDEGYVSNGSQSSKVTSSERVPSSTVLQILRRHHEARSPHILSASEGGSKGRRDDYRDLDDPLRIPVSPFKRLAFATAGDKSSGIDEDTDDDTSLAIIRRKHQEMRRDSPQKRTSVGRIRPTAK